MEKRVRGRPRGGGSKLHRTETITIRLDPKLRYLAEIAGRAQRRTVSSVMEWAFEKALKDIVLKEGTVVETNLGFASNFLWDPDEIDRFVKLAVHYPELLTYEEQVLWKLIKECPWLWHGASKEQGRWKVPVRAEDLNYQLLRAEWETLKKVASGEEDPIVLSPAERADREIRRFGHMIAQAGSRAARRRMTLTTSEPHEQNADQKTSSQAAGEDGYGKNV